MNDCHHVVIDKLILKSIKKEELTEPEISNRISKTHQAFGDCGNKWSSINKYEDSEFIFLSQKRIKIYDVAEDKIIPHIKQWKHVPFTIQKMTEEDMLVYKED